MWGTITDAIVGITFCWIVWVVFDSLRRYLTVKSQASVQERIFARIDSASSLIELASDESGRKFLESLTVERSEPTSPYARILNGIQAGIVLVFFGIALFFLHHHTTDEHSGLLIFGTGAIGLGIGFILAAAASVWFSRMLGLFDRDRRG